MQKAIVINHHEGTEPSHAVFDLNSHLKNGWHVVSVSPMGVGGGGETSRVYWSALVIIETDEE